MSGLFDKKSLCIRCYLAGLWKSHKKSHLSSGTATRRAMEKKNKQGLSIDTTLLEFFTVKLRKLWATFVVRNKSNAPINGLPQDGGGRGGGATHRKMSFSPPLGLHFESNSHPWGELIGTHNSLYCSTEHLQRVFKIMVPTNFVHFLKCRGHILTGYLVWLAI